MAIKFLVGDGINLTVDEAGFKREPQLGDEFEQVEYDEECGEYSVKYQVFRFDPNGETAIVAYMGEA